MPAKPFLRSYLSALGASLALITDTASGAERQLIDFGKLDMSSVQSRDAEASVQQRAGQAVLFLKTGHTQKWPGITIPAAGGAWDLTRFAEVSVALKNTGTNRATLICRVDNPGTDGTRDCVTGSLTLDAGKSGDLHVPLRRTSEDKLGGKLFGMRGYPVKACGAGTLDPSRVNEILFFTSQPAADHRFELGAVRAIGDYVPPTAWTSDADPYFPCIDTFGQYRHKSWPGKTKTLRELQQNRETEAQSLASDPGPADWDRFGGWSSGPKLKGSGFFRVQKHDGRWWLIDPDGRLFFSHGIDCVRMFEVTPIDERASWFEQFPGDSAEFAEFIIPRAFCLKGHYAGKSPRAFSFASANLKRKYGTNWKEACGPVIHLRLKSWGLNTIGMWSDDAVRLLRRTPYVDAIGSSGSKLIEGSEGYWGKFPDPFDPTFKERLARSMAGKAKTSAGDPWCLGYFCDNELAWGDETSLALGALRSAPNQAAKQVFIEDLRAKYDTIERLNGAWGTTHETWDALVLSRTPPDTRKAAADLGAFYTRIAEQYFRTVRDTIRAVAPNQLFLGCRFAWGNARATAAAAKFCDVVSFNLYRRSVADFHVDGLDVPLIIGEFHFGALDRGMFHTGLVSVGSQAERAQAYRDYVAGALRHPQFVGCHWFQYQDEPTTGRVYDEENYQIGFVDIADTPYAETIAASREIGKGMYRMRAGRVETPR